MSWTQESAKWCGVIAGWCVLTSLATAQPNQNRTRSVPQATAQQPAPIIPAPPPGAGLPPNIPTRPTAPDAAVGMQDQPPGTRGSPAQAPQQNVSPDVQRNVSREVNRTSRFQSDNLFARGTGRINILSDFFGSGQNEVTIAQPYSFFNVPSEVVGSNALGFDVGGNQALDLFTVGQPDANFAFHLSEPIPPTGAPIPTGAGFQYAGGIATPTHASGSPTFGEPYDLTYVYTDTLLIPAGGNLLLGRQKIAANVSPIPRTRVFLDYSFFENTPLLAGTDVHRWTPGFEYAFGDVTSSVEMRVPMGVTINSDIFSDALDDSQYEFGNLFFAWKSVLVERDTWLISGGVSVTVPTGDDINVFASNNLGTSQQVLQIRNESVHVQPYLGWFAHANRVFAQGFLQTDVDVNGSTVMVNRNLNQAGLTQLGVVQNTPLMYVDMQLGYWLRRYDQSNSSARPGITGLAPLWEMHFNRSLQASDVVGSTTNFAASGGYQVGAPLSDIQLNHMVFGLMVEHNFDTQLSVGFATPIGNGVDNAFDGELRAALNHYF